MVAPVPMRKERRLAVRKLHSVTGVVPLGAFLIAHLYITGHAVHGREPFAAVVRSVERVPAAHVLEFLLFLLPLALHAALGIWLLGTERSREASSDVPELPRSLLVLERFTGIVAGLFIAFHLYQFQWQRWFAGLRSEDLYDHLYATLDNRLTAMVYLVGLSSTVFHFAGGVWISCVRFRFAVGRRAQYAAAMVIGAAGLVLWIGSLNILSHFYAGVTLVPGVWVPE